MMNSRSIRSGRMISEIGSLKAARLWRPFAMIALGTAAAWAAPAPRLSGSVVNDRQQPVSGCYINIIGVLYYPRDIGVHG